MRGMLTIELFGTTSSFLILDKAAKVVLEENTNVEVGYLPFDLLDHKGEFTVVIISLLIQSAFENV